MIPTVSTSPLSKPAFASGKEAELDRGRETAGGGDVLRLLDRLAIELRQPVDEGAVREALGDGVIGAVVLLVDRRVAEAEVAREIDDARAGRHQLGHLLGAHLVWEAEEDDVHSLCRLAGGDPFELELGTPLEVRVNGGERLADEVDRSDANELDVGVEEEAANQLRAAVARSADDGGFEALRGHGGAGAYSNDCGWPPRLRSAPGLR